jgi:hypothetical protein
MKINKLHGIIFAVLLSLGCADVDAEPRIAVLDFELMDMTLAPGIPAEIARTASIKPMLENALKKSGFEIVSINSEAQQQATAGVGYLFDHPDAAAQLAGQYGADYVLVGRLHKPSFLFFYLLGHLVDVKKQTLAGEYTDEVKGGEKKLVAKGVESLTEKVSKTLSTLK